MVPEEMDDQDETDDMDDEDVFLSFYKELAGTEPSPSNTSEVLMRSLLAGRRETEKSL